MYFEIVATSTKLISGRVKLTGFPLINLTKKKTGFPLINLTKKINFKKNWIPLIKKVN